ncbi:MAG: hypothetical protein ACRDFX_01580 [Chloroflexota bacterium]
MRRALLAAVMALGGVLGVAGRHVLADTGTQPMPASTPQAFCPFSTPVMHMPFSAATPIGTRVIMGSQSVCGSTLTEVMGVSTAGPGWGPYAGTRIYYTSICFDTDTTSCKPKGLQP